MPTPEDPNTLSIDYYNQNAQAFFDGTASLDMAPFYSAFAAHLPPHPHILDAGCGSGRDTRYFLSQGFTVTAFDASPELAKLASAFTGQPVLCRTFHDVTETDAYDGIWASASLLHVPRAHILDALHRLARALKSGGVFYLSFKHGDGETFNNGRLFNNYEEPSFAQLLVFIPSLSISRLWVTTDLRPSLATQHWLNALLLKLPL